jgi:hypothetical protein
MAQKPILYLDNELFLSMLKGPVLNVPNDVQEHFDRVLVEFNKKIKEFSEFKDTLKNLDKKTCNELITKFTQEQLEQHILYSHNPMTTQWDQDRNKKEYLTKLIQKYSPNIKKYVKYHSFIVFGDAHTQFTKDIDVALFVENELDFHKEIDQNAVRQELKTIGYPDLPLDINLVTLIRSGKDCDISQIQKGGKELQNIIYYTHHLHKQAYPNPITRPLELDNLTMSLPDRCMTVCKFVIDNLPELLGSKERKENKAIRIKAYAGGWAIVDYGVDIMDRIVKLGRQNNTKWTDAMKSLVMKTIQVLLLEKNREVCYTKPDLAKKYAETYGDQKQCALWFLTRGNQGNYDEEFMTNLFGEFKAFAKIANNKIKFEQLKCEYKTDTNTLFDAFMENPIDLTPKCVSMIETKAKLYNNSLNLMFISECVNTDKLPTEVLQRTITSPQRSLEWEQEYKFYKCGSTTSVKEYHGKDWVQYYSNLVRGSLCESIVIDHCTFLDLLGEIPIKIQVGLIVEQKGVKSRGCAPDLILKLNSGKLVIVEIKSLVGKPLINNADYRRAVHLSQLQLITATNLIGKQHCADFGLLIFLYVHQVDNKHVFETYASKVKL